MNPNAPSSQECSYTGAFAYILPLYPFFGAHFGRDGSFECTVAASEMVIALKCRYWAYLSQRERLALPLGVLAKFGWTALQMYFLFVQL